MLFDDNTGLLLRALRFAAEKHRDQRRKDIAGSPYINHPISVAETLWTLGGIRERNILVAAILHDTLEDTETNPTEIFTIFGQEVLELVLEVTDDKNLPKAERKRLQIENAPHKSLGAKLIKMADKICNLNDVLYSPPQDWPLARLQEYVLWTEQVTTRLQVPNEMLAKYYTNLLISAKIKLQIT